MIMYRGIRRNVRQLLQSLVQTLAINPYTRRVLNQIYFVLNYQQKNIVHRLFSRSFRNGRSINKSSVWTIEFLGKRLKLPLRVEQIIIDWDLALSVLGHEPEIKEIYSNLIRSAQRPDLFIDIGTNYGTHSLLFLLHGIDTISFEPNTNCHNYFLETCKLNGITPHLEAVALGNKASNIELWFPKDETWLGSVDPRIKDTLQSQYTLTSQIVRVVKLDDYLENFRGHRVLLKIDTEGSEYQILQGAIQTLQECKPLLMFECLAGENRGDVFDLLDGQAYTIHNLAYNGSFTSPAHTHNSFVSSLQNNFVGLSKHSL